jgi:predicted metal-binding membrane protein
MGSIAPGRRVAGPFGARSRVTTSRRMPLLSLAIVLAWLVAIVAEVTGMAVRLHHDALIEGETPVWIGVPVFLVGWLVMVVAMMVPASRSTIHLVERRSSRGPRPRIAKAAFIAAFLLAWAIYGLLAFAGDAVLHHLVDVTPALAERPWVIEAGVLALAGAYQFSPIKRRSLEACRRPAVLLQRHAPEPGWFRRGLDYGVACLGSSGALMLLMFAEGFANLWWMAGLAAVMAYEAVHRPWRHASGVTGAVLLVLSLAVLVGPSTPG